jgi:hypothetical protein
MKKDKKGIIKKVLKSIDGSSAHEGVESKTKEISEGKNDNEKDMSFKKYTNLKK